MNRLKKAFSMENTETITDTRKKRFSFFKSSSSSEKVNKNVVVDLPRLNISSPCVEYPPHIEQPTEKFRPRSTAHLDNYSSNVSFTSSSETTSTHNNNNQTQSIHSTELLPPAPPRRRSTKTSTYSNMMVSENSSIIIDQQQRSNNNDDDVESYLQLGMKYHEKGELEKATHYWRLSAESGSPLGLFFYGIALRHGWVRKENSIVYYIPITQFNS